MPTPLSLRAWPVVAMLAVTLVGAAIRLIDLGAASFDPSEVGEINTAEALRLPHAQAWSPVAPLSAWITAAALHWGDAEATLRLSSAVAGTLTILAVWALGLLSSGAETGMYAAVALAVSPLHVALSRRVGTDAWLTLLVTLAALAFIWAMQASAARRRQLLCMAVALLACTCGSRALLGLAAMAITAAALAVPQPSVRRLAARSCLMLLLLAAAGSIFVFYHPPPVDDTLPRPDFGWTFPLQLLSQLATGQPQRPWAAAVLLAGAILGLVADGGSAVGILSTLWVLIGVAGVLFGEWLIRLPFKPQDVGFVLPAYLLLGAAGLAWLRRTLCSDRARRGAQGAALALLLAIELPGLVGGFNQQPASWRAAAQVVGDNIRPNDVLVVLAEQPAFAFYAPDLAQRMEPDVRPSRASGYFVHRKRGWLVAPTRLKERIGWTAMVRWLERFPPVDLSPDAGITLLYMGQGGRDELFLETAYFTLPTATLVRGTLLLDWLQQIGPVPAVLWKVDQIALSREALDFRNPSLLSAVYDLAQHNQGGRAASLAYRLATAEPDWDEAQRALAAFRPGR